MAKVKNNVKDMEGLPKCLSGIRGLDEILDGGLPKGRPTLLAGGTGNCTTGVRRDARRT